MPSSSSVLALSLMLAGPSPTLRPEALWTAWPDVRFVSTPAPCLRHEELVERIRELEARHAGGLSVEEVARSVEGRPIHLLTLGRGPRRVLLWSQMHGDEPSATPVVLVESGGLPPGWTHGDLTRLNFVALLTALSGLVEDDLEGEDPEVYETLLRNEDSRWVDVLVRGGHVWQPQAGAPYPADLAFDRLDHDPFVAACKTAGPPGASRVREIGDGRFLGAARRVDATGHLVTTPFVASVRGLDAREWLDPEALTALGRLGVARLRWRVEAGDGEEARTAAEFMVGDTRPAIEVVSAASEACFLEVAGRPAIPVSLRLDEVLDALTSGAWRSRALGRPFADLLGPLATCSLTAAPGPPLTPDAPASFLLLRSQAPIPEATGPSTRVARPPEEELKAEELHLEAVFIDGREPAAGR